MKLEGREGTRVGEPVKVCDEQDPGPYVGGGERWRLKLEGREGTRVGVGAGKLSGAQDPGPEGGVAGGESWRVKLEGRWWGRGREGLWLTGDCPRWWFLLVVRGGV